jgi:hypothetical protein
MSDRQSIGDTLAEHAAIKQQAGELYLAFCLLSRHLVQTNGTFAILRLFEDGSGEVLHESFTAPMCWQTLADGIACIEAYR